MPAKDTARTELFLAILYSQTDKVHTGGWAGLSRSPSSPECRCRQRGARCSYTLPGLSLPYVWRGLALTPRLLLVEPEQGVQLLFWSNSTNSGYISQHKRVRKPFCYHKKLKDLLRIGQLIFSDLVLSNIPCALWRFCNLLYATAT